MLFTDVYYYNVGSAGEAVWATSAHNTPHHKRARPGLDLAGLLQIDGEEKIGARVTSFEEGCNILAEKKHLTRSGCLTIDVNSLIK